MKCPKCQFDNPEGAKFCNECGHKFGEQLAIEGERKQVTVLFSDLSGYTAISERLDPEEVKNIISRIFGEIAQVVVKYDGSIEKFIGDAVVAFFGVPKAHEDDPMRAIGAAKEIHEIIDALGHQFETRIRMPLSMHTGINTGLVVTGEVTMEKGTLGVTGDTVNVASRLSGLAKPGEILVGQDTYRQAGGYFAFEKMGSTKVKGKTEPVPVYRVVEEKVEVGHIRGLATQGINSPLVGREAELLAIKGCVNRLLNGQGGILSVIGEAGLGKSRLMAEICNRTDLSSLQWLEGGTLSYGQNISYWPFHEIIRQFAGITEEDDEETAWAKLESRVAVLFPNQVAEILPYIATLVALPVKGKYEERVKYLDGEAMGRQIFYTSRCFFERLAQTRPLMVVFEDLHWVDQSSAVLLEHLMPLVKSVPLLLCGVSRLDPDTPAMRLQQIAARDYADWYTEIRLEPLSSTDSAQLVHNLLEIEDLSHKAREIILRKAEGNPFFVEEVIRVLIAIGALVRDPSTGRWQATGQVEHVTIPDTIQGVIMARLDRLEEDIKQVLRIASVIGRSFLYRVLRAIDEADRELDQHLAELQQVELIREKSRVPELEYIFKHALAQEVTYESTLLQRRRELHAQVGKCIETLFADRLEEFYSLLAYHYARAEQWEKAQEYLFKAGDQANRLAADGEVLTHYRRALEAYTRVFGNRWDPLRRAQLERKIGEAFYWRSEHEQAREYSIRALDLLGVSYPTASLAVNFAIVRELLKQVVHRLLPRLFLRFGSKQEDLIAEEMACIFMRMGWIDHFIDHKAFLLDSLMVLNQSEQRGFKPGIAQGSGVVGTICIFLGLHSLAQAYLQRAVDLAEQTRSPAQIGLAYELLGYLKVHTGRWQDVQESLQRAVNAYREAGDLHGQGISTLCKGVILQHEVGFMRALQLCEEVFRLGENSADVQITAWAMTETALMQWRAGVLEADEAIHRLQRATEICRTIPDYLYEARALGWWGHIYLGFERWQEALEVLKKSAQFISQHDLRGWFVTPPRTGLAAAYLMAAEQATGTERDGWLKQAAVACRIALNHSKVDFGAKPEAMRLRGRYEWLKDNRNAAQQWWRKSLVTAQNLKMRYEEGMTHFEIGKHLNDRAQLKKAEKVLTEIGAELDLARVRGLFE